MIDNFSLGLTHGLLLLAAWRLMRRTDLSPPLQGRGDSRPEGAAEVGQSRNTPDA